MTKKKEELRPETQEKSSVPAPKFTVEKLRQNCQKLFNVSQSTFDGAVYGLSGEYTVPEMKKIISSWQNKEVK